jgi:hypothetical protein
MRTETKEEKYDVSGETVSVQSQLGKQEISLHILDTAHRARKACLHPKFGWIAFKMNVVTLGQWGWSCYQS